MESPQEQGGDKVGQRNADMQKGTLEVPIQERVTNSTNLRSEADNQSSYNATYLGLHPRGSWGCMEASDEGGLENYNLLVPSGPSQ